MTTTTEAGTAMATTTASPATHVEAFAFGDPVPVLDRRDLLDYLECVPMFSKWYEPPVSMQGLALTFRAAVHHSSSIYVKRNILTRCFKPSRLMSKATFSALALDYLVFGNAYPQAQRAMSGRPMRIERVPAKYVRRGIDMTTYWWVQAWRDERPLADVFHLMEPDINQEVYGLPEYLSALNSIWLNESATLFRRKYYQNGSHAGFIFYISETRTPAAMTSWRAIACRLSYWA